MLSPLTEAFFSLALAHAIAAAEIETGPDCEACEKPDSGGLCHSERCRRQVLPQLKEPSWHRDAHSSLYHELGAAKVDAMNLSPAGLRIKQSKERKRERAAKRLTSAVLGSGQRTKTRHRSGQR